MSFDVEKFLTKNAMMIDKTIEKYIPRIYNENAILFKLIPPRYQHNLQAINKAIAEPIWEFLDRGGKRWRPCLFLLICEALGRKSEELLDFAIIPEVIHNATLIVDDIEDESEMRRGKPCSHKIFGIDIAINAGNAMYYLPLLVLMENKAKLPAEKLSMLYEIYVREMINLSLGQATDIAWHKGLANADAIDEYNYLQMCANKTGTLARMAAKMAAVLADADAKLTEQLGKFAESIGIAFQIQDDILDLMGEEFAEKKGARGMDITEGKRTLMVIYTLKKASSKDRAKLLEILKMKTEKQELRDEAINIMKKYGAIEYAKNYAEKIIRESWQEIDSLLPSSDAKNKLKAFTEYLIKRKI